MKKNISSFLLAVAIVLISCTPAAPTDSTPSKDAKITVAAYLDGDNNLERAIVANLKEMGQRGSSNQVQILAKLDRIPDIPGNNRYTSESIFNTPNFDDTKIFYVGQQQLITISDLGERDMSAQAELQSFLEFTLKTYPAKNTVVVVADHGAGAALFVEDDTSGRTTLNMQKFRNAARSALDAVGQKKFAVVIFDACLMADIAGLVDLADVADFVVASEDNSTARGLDYNYLNEQLQKNPNMSAREIAAAAVDAYTVSHPKLADATMTALDLSSAPQLVAALARVSPSIKALSLADEALIKRTAVEFPRTDKFPKSQNKDLVMVLAQAHSIFGARGQTNVTQDTQTAIDIYKRMISKQYIGSNFKGAGGFYINWGAAGRFVSSDSTFNRSIGWDEVVKEYDEEQATPSSPIGIRLDTPIPTAAGIKYSASVDGDIVAAIPSFAITQRDGSNIEIISMPNTTFLGTNLSYVLKTNPVYYLTDCPQNASAACTRSLAITYTDDVTGNIVVPIIYQPIGAATWCEATATFDANGRFSSAFSDTLCPGVDFSVEILADENTKISPQRIRLDSVNNKLVSHSFKIPIPTIPLDRTMVLSSKVRLEGSSLAGIEQVGFIVNDSHDRYFWTLIDALK